MIIKNHFLKKGFALGLVLKQRLTASRKQPIAPLLCTDFHRHVTRAENFVDKIYKMNGNVTVFLNICYAVLISSGKKQQQQSTAPTEIL